MAGRAEQRAEFTLRTRVKLLEGEFDGIEAEMRSTRAVLVGILISIATASVMLAINVVLGVL